jgi:hypothetical protein
MEETFGALDEPYKARLLTADLEAFLAMTQERPSLEEVLSTMLMPCCLYVGEQDPVYPAVQACRHQIPQVTFVSLPGLTHAEAFIRSDLVLPEVITFLKAVPRQEVRGLHSRRPAGSWRARQEPPLLRRPLTSASRLTLQSMPSGQVSLRHLRPPSRSLHSASPKTTKF